MALDPNLAAGSKLLMTSSTEIKTTDGNRELSQSPARIISAGDVESHNHDALAPGHRLDEFEIVRVLGAGGFGIVYLALDQVLLRHVAIKEYFPTSLASRNKNAQVEARSRETGKTFDLGLESFINEARLLARFDHPSLVKVHRFWKQNGTAYMVMQYYPGQTLKSARRNVTSPPDEKWLRAFMDPLLGALEVLHAQDVFHRDIAPDNILLLPDGQPVILDFGSARRVISDRTQSLTAVLKPNFSPVEQYAEDAGMRQGAYTDIFALGGTVRFMMTGEAPTPAVMRAVRDTLPALSRDDPQRCASVSHNFLAAIDWTLALAPSDRPQTVAVLRQALDGGIAIPEPSARYASMEDGAPAFGPTAALAKTKLVPRPSDGSAIRTIHLGAASRARPSSGSEESDTEKKSARISAIKVIAIALVGLSFISLAGSAFFVRATAMTPSGEEVILNAPPETTPARGQQPFGPRVALTGSNSVPDHLPASTASGEMDGQAKDGASRPLEVRRPSAAERRQSQQASDAIPRRGDHPPPQATSRSAEDPRTAPTSSDRRLLENCTALGFFARSSCVSRACALPNLRGTPECLELKRIEDQRQRRMDQ